MTLLPQTPGTFLRDPYHILAMLRLLVLGGLALLGIGSRIAHPGLYWLITIAYAATIVACLAARWWRIDLPRVGWLIFLTDVVMVSALIVLRGEQVTSFMAAYFGLVLMAAIAQGIGTAILNAILVAALYGGVSGLVTTPEQLLTFEVLSQVVFFFIIALFMGHMASEARREHLEREITERALAMKDEALRQSEEQLQTAQEALQAAERLRSLGMLSAGIAHEIRNPLAALASSLEPAHEILAEARAAIRTHGAARAELEELEELVEDCRTASDQLAHVARDLTSIARQGSLSIEPIDVGDALQGCARLLRQRLVDGLRLEVASDEGCVVLADAGRLMQMLLNLATNALDAMDGQDEGTLRLEGRCAGDRVVLRVSDDGPGIPPAVRDRLFEPFVTTKGTGHGTGLGLHLVSEMAKAQNGTITYETETGRGTLFEIVLPATRDHPTGEKHHERRDHQDDPDRGRRAHDPQGAAAHAAAGAL